MIRSACVLSLLLLAPLAATQDAPAPSAPPLERRFDDLELTLSFPAGWNLRPDENTGNAQVRARWNGKLGESALKVRLHVIGQAQMPCEEPNQVLENMADSLQDPAEGGDRNFRYDEMAHVAGKYGWASYATYARCNEKEAEGSSQVFRLAGLLESAVWCLEVRCQPAPSAADAKAVHAALLAAVTSDGPQRDPKWTKAEAQTRWEESVPEELKGELGDVLRTAHYVILTNSSGGKSFAKKMEECYVAIRKVFPFDEVPGRRLMPVFLFRTNDQYYSFLVKQVGWSVEQARRSQGVAFNDLYTTWYEAPGDPVHIHEATHQIFRNRLGLGGAGSWFQEGVAEYMSTKDNERGMAATAVEKGRHVPLQEFVRVQSLLMSAPAEDTTGANQAGNQYKQAALFIEFLRESKFGKAKFLDWLHAVGSVRRNDVPAIEAAGKRVYGVGLDELEKQFVDYCKKR